MKTAMQELRDILENCKMVDITDEQKSIFSSIIYQIDIYLLEKEKEQIISSYNDGVNDGNTQGLQGKEGNGNYATLEEYYNQTYNQNK